MQREISYLFPGIDFERECVLVDEGAGPYISQWNRAEPQPTPEQIAAAAPIAAQIDLIAQYDRALTNHLDATARQRRYDNRISCAVRAGFPGPFQAEAIAFAIWMDACNAYAYQLMADVQAGARTLPSVEAFITELPDLVWP